MTYNLNLKALFLFFEHLQDGGGTISVQELRAAINLLGGDLRDEQVEVLMADLDFDRSGEVDLEEFIAFFYALVDDEKARSKEGTIITDSDSDDSTGTASSRSLAGSANGSVEDDDHA